MFRNIFRIFLIVLVIAFIRYVLMTIGRALRNPSPDSPKPDAVRNPSKVPGETQGVLRKDPQCGTYVSESSSVSMKVGGESLYFCSTACRDKYAKQAQHS
jgi:YHS domain-containing protein